MVEGIEVPALELRLLNPIKGESASRVVQVVLVALVALALAVSVVREVTARETVLVAAPVVVTLRLRLVTLAAVVVAAWALLVEKLVLVGPPAAWEERIFLGLSRAAAVVVALHTLAPTTVLIAMQNVCSLVMVELQVPVEVVLTVGPEEKPTVVVAVMQVHLLEAAVGLSSFSRTKLWRPAARL